MATYFGVKTKAQATETKAVAEKHAAAHAADGRIAPQLMKRMRELDNRLDALRDDVAACKTERDNDRRKTKQAERECTEKTERLEERITSLEEERREITQRVRLRVNEEVDRVVRKRTLPPPPMVRPIKDVPDEDR